MAKKRRRLEGETAEREMFKRCRKKKGGAKNRGVEQGGEKEEGSAAGSRVPGQGQGSKLGRCDARGEREITEAGRRGGGVTNPSYFGGGGGGPYKGGGQASAVFFRTLAQRGVEGG